jgi:GNAT superfamily N-acetyltransferase
MSRLETVVTYLQMFARPARPPIEPPRPDLAVVHARRPTVSYYRWLYDTVGAPWLWTDRRRMSDAELASIIHDERVEVHVLHVAGVPAGYAELDRRGEPDIELAYFGMMPEFIGERLGPYLLDWSIQRAWSYGPRRYWVHTQTLDHPRALPLYKKLGFDPYREDRLELDIVLPR